MVQLASPINLDNVQPASFEPIPAGWYPAQITGSEIKDTKTGGQYLSLEFTILGANFSGRKVWSNLNIVNANQKTVDIAYQHLAGICNAIGYKHQVQNTDVLHGKPMEINVTIKDDPTYGTKNEVKAYRAASGKTETSFTGAAPSQPAQVTPPWAQKK